MPTPTRARLAVSALFTLSGCCFATWAARIPDLKTALHLSEGELGRLLLALPVGSVVALPLAGWLTDTVGARRVVLGAAVLYAATLPLLGLAPSVWWLAGALALFGFAGDLLNIAMNAQALDVQDQYEAPILGAFHGTWSLAGFGAGLLATALARWQPLAPAAHFGWVAAGLLALVSTFGFFGFLSGPPAIGLLAEWGSLRLSLAVVAAVALGVAALGRGVRAAAEGG